MIVYRVNERDIVNGNMFFSVILFTKIFKTELGS